MVRNSRYKLKIICLVFLQCFNIIQCYLFCFYSILQYLHIFYAVIGVGGSGAAANGINLNAISTIGKNAGKGECYHHVVKYCIIILFMHACFKIFHFLLILFCFHYLQENAPNEVKYRADTQMDLFLLVLLLHVLLFIL